MIDLPVLAGDWSEETVAFSKEEGGWIGFDPPRQLYGTYLELTSYPNIGKWRSPVSKQLSRNKIDWFVMRFSMLALVTHTVIITWNDGMSITTRVSHGTLTDLYKASRGWR